MAIAKRHTDEQVEAMKAAVLKHLPKHGDLVSMAGFGDEPTVTVEFRLLLTRKVRRDLWKAFR